MRFSVGRSGFDPRLELSVEEIGYALFPVWHHYADVEHRSGTGGNIRGGRLMGKTSMKGAPKGGGKGLTMGAVARGAIAPFLYSEGNWEQTQLSLDGHPHLKEVMVQAPDIIQYGCLLAGGGR